MNCRNAINSSIYNSDRNPPTNKSVTNGTTNDVWDTIDAYNNGGATVPETLPAAWDSSTYCSAAYVWLDTSTDGLCNSGSDTCIFQDQISGLFHSPLSATNTTWTAANTACEALTIGGNTNWRLPTGTEIQMALVHGLRDLSYKGGTIGTSSNNSYFMPNLSTGDKIWSLTQTSDNTMAYAIGINGVDTTYALSTNMYYYCVHE
jgi:hypothetical protein